MMPAKLCEGTHLMKYITPKGPAVVATGCPLEKHLALMSLMKLVTTEHALKLPFSDRRHCSVRNVGEDKEQRKCLLEKAYECTVGSGTIWPRTADCTKVVFICLFSGR